jgi:hypothetical protein
MKKNRFTNNNKSQKSVDLNTQEVILQEKKYEKFYNLVKKRLHTL